MNLRVIIPAVRSYYLKLSRKEIKKLKKFSKSRPNSEMAMKFR